MNYRTVGSSSVENSPWQTLELAIGWLKTFRPDALVLTGDLVDDGWRQGYRLVAESLRSLDCPVHLLPGNGDDVQLMRSELAAVGTWINATGPMHFRTAVDGLTLLGVDVTVAGQSYGDVLPHLPWLMSALADLTGHYHTTFSPLVMGAVVTVFFAVFFLISTGATARLARRKWVAVGALTYPLYLIHQNVGFGLFNLGFARVNAHLLMWGVVALMLVAAYLVNRAERIIAPRMRDALLRLVRRSPAPAPAVGQQPMT